VNTKDTLINRDALILDILKKIKGGFREPYIKEPWDKGWGEIAEKIRQGFDLSALKPQYYGDDPICRHDNEFRPSELYEAMDRALRNDAARYLKGAKKVVEIGCGTGINLPHIASICPDAEITAADWSEASQEIVAAIAAYLKRPITGVKYNMFSPAPLIDGHHVITVHALEQIGTKWELLLEEMQKASLCVHLEPILELYDETILMDYLAAEYHRTRGYLSGFLPAVRKLEREGKAEILTCERRKFGNRYHDSYSLLVWRPNAG
jgi:cyclopropane fatty-acyl-phospholipid synthase-like methyltransferase